jgi:hypothetical protein
LGVIIVAVFLFYTSVITTPPEVAVTQSGAGVFTSLSDISGFAQSHWRHFIAYGAFAYGLAYATDHWGLSLQSRGLLVVTTVVLFGLGIELIQPFAQRTFAVNDIAANTLGAALVLPWFLVRPVIEVRPLSDLV